MNEHYRQGKIECMEAIESATTNMQGIDAFWVGNIIKYVWRYRYKDGSKDLIKARDYLDKLLFKVSKEENDAE